MAVPDDHTLGPQERIKSRKLLDQLFSEGKSINKFPFRMVYLTIPFSSPFPVQAGFSVPKRKIRKAHDRNRIRRLMREAYRLNKNLITEPCKLQATGLAIIFIFQGNQALSFEETQEKIILLLQRLRGEYAKADK